jgi:uncharacterized protein
MRIAFFFSFAALLIAGCNGLFYHPRKEIVRYPSDIGLPYERVTISTPGQPTLAGWLLPTTSEVRGTVLYLHGNAENISTHFAAVYWLPKEGYQVFLFDYAGYGESEGTVSLSGIHRDVERMIGWVAADHRTMGKPLILFGSSLGGTMALYAAAQSEKRGALQAVVAEAPFSSYRSIAREKLSLIWLTSPFRWPLGFLVSDHFSPLGVAEKMNKQVLLIHGTTDAVVPLHHSADLCAAIGERCTLLEVPGAGHGEPLVRPDVRAQISAFLRGNAP